MQHRPQTLRRARTAAAVAILLTGFALPAIARAHRSALGTPNVLRLTVRTPRSGFNRMVVRITVCVPGTERCATIDDVMVDTGSTGLRLEASAVPSWLRLPAFLGLHGKPLAECLHFVHDHAWGSLHRADIRLGGLTAAGLPIQIIADDGGPQPAECPLSAVQPTASGTLGIGPQLFDCADPCEQSTASPGVFVDEAGAWRPVRGRVDPAYRLPNPVSLLPDHNNGVVFDLPGAPVRGARQVRGTLTFGVGTAPNNRLGAARILRLGQAGRFTTTYRGKAYPDSAIDSGTETYVVADDRLPRCAGLDWAFCASPSRRLDAALVGRDGATLPVSFRVGDYAALRGRRVGATDSIAVAAAPDAMAFVWGAPFFLGKRVFVILDGRGVPGAAGLQGPAYAVR